MRLLKLAALAALTGCVSSPETIKPDSVSTVGYDILACPQLAAEDARVAGLLGPLTYYQRREHTNQAVGAVIVGVPMAMATATDKGPEVARLKGEMVTIAAVKKTKACPEPAAIVDDRRPIEDIKAETARNASKVYYGSH